jgi:hypothetical protein
MPNIIAGAFLAPSLLKAEGGCPLRSPRARESLSPLPTLAEGEVVVVSTPCEHSTRQHAGIEKTHAARCVVCDRICYPDDCKAAAKWSSIVKLDTVSDAMIKGGNQMMASGCLITIGVLLFVVIIVLIL